MIGQDELKQRLRELAKASPQVASVESEQRLRESFRSHQRRRRAWKYLTGVAASLLIGGASYLISHVHGRGPAAATEGSYASPPGFLALPYAQSDVPLEHAVVVRVNMPPSEASALGVPFDPGARKRISADLLIGQDGMARAVRFVP
jgi:hypothetical protein